MKFPTARVPIGFALLSLGWLSVAVAWSFQTDWNHTPTPDQITFFESKIRPVLAENCFSCHGPKMQMAGLRLDTFASLQRGFDKGPVVFPGDVSKSPLIRAIRHTGPIKMPMAKKLRDTEIADLEAWVKMGAPWARATAIHPGSKQPLWSLMPVKKPVVPKVKDASWVRNPIDAFVLARLEVKKMSPTAQADKRTLLRRLNYDLIGLPPTAAEVDAFLADKSPNAYEKVVDRLLASPHYGERLARLWLDVARYADTKGYVFEEDRNFPHAYTYRDWVIEAFNRDLPYDQFIVQQLAADRLPEVQNGDDKRPLAALGFLTVGRRFLNNPHDIIDDRIDVTTRGFLGFTVSCARCHDHKFDPVPAQDYYSLYAVFASSLETTPPISKRAIREPWEDYSQRLATAERNVRDLIVSQVKAIRERAKNTDLEKQVSAEVKKVLQGLREEQIPNEAQLKTLVTAFDPVLKERLGRLQLEVAQIRRDAPALPEFAMAMMDAPRPRDAVVFRRGNPGSPGEPAPRRFLSALSKKDREHWTEGSGRLELAREIASKDNPLTARVFVNRIWQHHFGSGLVRTPSDFGFQGEKPTHPELLDFLAFSLMEEGWSIKNLHRLITTSSTYRQSSEVSRAVYDSDPENRMWSRVNRRRLDLEQMRDSVLFAAGQLETSRVGGKSVDLWSAPYSPRRSVYGFIERQNLPGIFKTFDFASPDTTSPRRFQTTVPQQALFFMNSPFVVEQARLVTARADIQSSKDDAQRVGRLYRQILGRLPDAGELKSALAFLKPGALSTVARPESEWQYGYGTFDPDKGRVASFTQFAHFADASYRVGPAFPDPHFGYLVLNAQGGHPGKGLQRSVIRRWVSPATMSVRISGNLHHPNAQGDGVRGRVVSSRSGVSGEWQAKSVSVRTEVATLEVQKGETIDFVVDCLGDEAFDAFSWAPIIQSADGKQGWNAAANFGPPAAPPVTRLALLAQALMMTNEFLFVD